MYELIFTPVDIIMFFFSGMALGFVLGAMLMKKTMKVMCPPDPNPDALQILHELAGIPLPDDGGASFHEASGDR